MGLPMGQEIQQAVLTVAAPETTTVNAATACPRSVGHIWPEGHMFDTPGIGI